MEKAERANLLRERFVELGGFFPFVRRSIVRPKEQPYRSRWKHGALPTHSVAQHIKELPGKWVFSPDPAPNRTTPQTSRTGRKSALQRIADRWDERKLAERLARR